MRKTSLFLLSLLLSPTAQAGNLFPPAGALADGKCPAGTVIFWTGESLACTPVAQALAIPTCKDSSSLQFDGTAFTCSDNLDATATACPVQCSNLPSLNYCHALVPSGTTNNVPSNTVVKKSDGTYAAAQGTTIEKDDCNVSGLGGLICTYGCTNKTWMLLNSRRRDAF